MHIIDAHFVLAADASVEEMLGEGRARLAVEVELDDLEVTLRDRGLGRDLARRDDDGGGRDGRCGLDSARAGCVDEGPDAGEHRQQDPDDKNQPSASL